MGGVADYTDELAKAIVGAGWEVSLATSRDHDDMRSPGAEVHHIFPYVRNRTRLGRTLRRLRLARLVNGMTHLAASAAVLRLARRCDVVHVQGGEWPPISAVQLTLLRMAHLPIVYTPHNTFDRGSHSYERSHAAIRRCASRTIVHSEYDRTQLSADQAAKAVVIPHGEYGGLTAGCAATDPSTARARLGLGTDKLVVLLFGQLRPDKGIGDLLGAALDEPRVQVVLAGEDHGALDEISALLDDEHLRQRVLLREGFASPDETAQLFAAADVVALPYQRASASGVLLLAYGCARPVIVYPVGGLPEYVIEGRTGWICKHADSASLAETLGTVLAAGPHECRTRGLAAREFAETVLAWDPIAHRTIAVYEDVLASR